MDERDDWLEGVRRWYFGGEAPAEALDDGPAWPDLDRARCADCSHRGAPSPQRPLASPAQAS